jgi:FtsH-binding integral membrane protein
MEENQPARAFARAEHSDYGGFFGVVGHSQSYLNLIYLLLSFPLGIFYFVFFVTGLSLGFGLAIIGIGLIILLFMLAAVRGLAALERQLGIWFLDARIPPPPPGPELLRHPLQALKKYVIDPYTWRSFAYLLVKFPFAIAVFVITVFLTSSSVAFLLAPLFYRYAPLHILTWRISSAQAALLCSAIGLILGVCTLHVGNVLAAGWRAFTVWTLTCSQAGKMELRAGPVVIP